MMNKGRFRAYSSILGKKESGNMIREWYDAKDWKRIITYMEEEARNFVEKYQVLKQKISELKFDDN